MKLKDFTRQLYTKNFVKELISIPPNAILPHNITIKVPYFFNASVQRKNTHPFSEAFEKHGIFSLKAILVVFFDG